MWQYTKNILSIQQQILSYLDAGMVMSFDTLSKVIKNLKTGAGSSYSVLAENYKYLSPKERYILQLK